MNDYLCLEENCTGCAACYNICKSNAIHMTRNKEGFLYPVIDEKACISCHQCTRVCPEFNIIEKAPKSPTVYAAYSKDFENIKRSSSGGIVFEIFKSVIQSGGVVFSAYMTSCFTVEFKKAKTLDDILAFQGSKYVESNPDNIYQEIQETLKEGSVVAFCGLPCQVAGLLSYLKRDYEKLYTIDLVCHGVPSGKLFQDYVHSMEQGHTINELVFRYKEKDWSPLLRSNCRIQFSNDETEIRDYKVDPYLTGFNSNIMFRPSCYHCSYASIPRISDLTVGDYMGLGVVFPYKGDSKDGISQVLVNSKKGEILFSKLSAQTFYEKRDLKECLYFNHNLWKATTKPVQRNNLYLDYEKKGYSYIEAKYLSNSLKKKIINMIKEFMRAFLGDRFVTKLIYLSYQKKGIIQKANDVYDEIKRKN